MKEWFAIIVLISIFLISCAPMEICGVDYNQGFYEDYCRQKGLNTTENGFGFKIYCEKDGVLYQMNREDFNSGCKNG